MSDLNTSGIEPTEFNVLVRLEIASQTSKAGSILLPETKVSRDQALNTRGILVAASPLAFNYDNWDASMKPQIGQRVMICKGAGEYITPEDSGDGHFYRLVKDKDVTAILRDPVVAKKAKAA